MCFYDMYRWQCNDWKWGNFRQHCDQEYRMGETCGMKMINHTEPLHGDCPLCQKIATKLRKLQRAKDDYQRFKDDPSRRATAEVKYKEALELHAEVTRLQEERMARMNRVGNSRRTDHRSHA